MNREKYEALFALMVEATLDRWAEEGAPGTVAGAREHVETAIENELKFGHAATFIREEASR